MLETLPDFCQQWTALMSLLDGSTEAVLLVNRAGAIEIWQEAMARCHTPMLANF